jgi:hypothetical protein
MFKKGPKTDKGGMELSLDNLKFIFEKRVVASTAVPYETAYQFLEDKFKGRYWVIDVNSKKEASALASDRYERRFTNYNWGEDVIPPIDMVCIAV